MVKGRNISFSEVVIAEVSGILVEGIRWKNNPVLLEDIVAVFQDPDEQLVCKGKGIHPTTLRKPW